MKPIHKEHVLLLKARAEVSETLDRLRVSRKKLSLMEAEMDADIAALDELYKELDDYIDPPVEALSLEERNKIYDACIRRDLKAEGIG